MPMRLVSWTGDEEENARLRARYNKENAILRARFNEGRGSFMELYGVMIFIGLALVIAGGVACWLAL